MGFIQRVISGYDSYSFREKANVIAGTIGGFLVPAAIIRYSNFPASKSIVEEVLYWVNSTIGSTPLNIAGAATGLIAGDICAIQLRFEKQKK